MAPLHAELIAGAYPANRDSTIVLRDGSTLAVRPIKLEDEAGLAHFFSSLSMESRILRFFAPVANADATAKRLVQVDYKSRYGLVAEAGAQGEIVAHAMYVEIGPRKAELALAVADAYQSRGLGTILLGQLAEAAAASGIDVFEAIVKPENHRMLSMLRESGFPVHARSEPGEVHAELPTALTPDGLRHFEDRERLAAIAAVGHLLAPRSVAVIGASRQRGGIGAELFHNLLTAGFKGSLYPVNPAATKIEEVPAFASVLDIPGEVEMAVITVPAAAVLDAARQCAAKGVRGLLDGIDRDRATAVIAVALAGDLGWMAPKAVAELLSSYGIPMVDTRVAVSPREAGREAKRLGPPVALKAIVPGLLHKSDAGAVVLDLKGTRAVERAATEVAARFEQSGRRVTGYQVQPMVAAGVEMLVGVVQEQQFGPVLACGAGGTATELLKDVAVSITPITRGEASRMVRALKTFPRLDGYRGAPRGDVGALEDVLLRVSAMVEAHPEVVEMDLNPLMVHPVGAVVVDARIRLEQRTPKAPLGSR